MSFETYIQGLFPLSIPSTTLASIMYNRGITANTEVSAIAAKTVDLAYADICMYVSKIPSDFTGSKDSDNGWSHSESSYKLTSSDKDAYKREANIIYQKYGESSSIRANLRIINIHGTPYYGS